MKTPSIPSLNTNTGQSDNSDSPQSLGKEHPLLIAIAADTVSNNYVAGLSKKICRNKNNVDNRHLNNFFVRSKKTQRQARKNRNKNTSSQGTLTLKALTSPF